MLRFIQRRRIKKVIKLMSTRLIVGYGSREYFSVGQVKTSTGELSACQQKLRWRCMRIRKILIWKINQSCKPSALMWRMTSSLVSIIPLKMCFIYSELVAGKAAEWKMECLIILVCTVVIKTRVNFINSINIFAVKD